MHIPYVGSARAPALAAGLIVCAAVVGSLAAVGSIPLSYASTQPEHSFAPGAAPATGAAAAAINSPSGPRCSGCGVVESIREMVAADNNATSKSYAITVRFRDGTKTVFNEATPRDWHAGERVLVIAGVTMPAKRR